jgi:hypothetical protein
MGREAREGQKMNRKMVGREEWRGGEMGSCGERGHKACPEHLTLHIPCNLGDNSNPGKWRSIPHL